MLRRTSLFAKFHFDTRPAHTYIYKGMAPADCSCIIGNYRGDPSCSQLKVEVGTADPQVGLPYILVQNAMKVFDARCASLVKVHEKWLVEKGATQAARNGLLKFVSVLADVLQQFLTIHPYMDGNGHCGRLLVFMMMARAGYTPVNWDVDSKQPYGQALSDHRRGKPGALQTFLLQAIVGFPPAATAPVPVAAKQPAAAASG